MSDHDGGILTVYVRAGLSIAITLIIMLIGAWAVDLNRTVNEINNRQREVMIRLRAIEVEHARQWPSP